MWRYLTPFQVAYEPAKRYSLTELMGSGMPAEPSFDDTMAEWWTTKAAAAEILDIMI